jgi:hypothetical protein
LILLIARAIRVAVADFQTACGVSADHGNIVAIILLMTKKVLK